MRRLRPAFVLTTCVVASACGGSEAPRDDGLPGNPPEILSRKREGKRTVSETSESATVSGGALVSLHPKDGQGRTIYVRDDNSCFVETPKEGDPPPRTDGWVNNVPVDCPPLFDDPAWDDRRSNWELKKDEKANECLFDYIRGNPPPASVKATCPANVAEPKK